MAVLKILLLLAAVQVVHPKPLIFKEMKMKKNFEFSLKPLLKPVTFIKEYKPFKSVKVQHTIGKRSPIPPPPDNSPSSPAPLLNVGLEKFIELNSAVSVPPHHEKETEVNNNIQIPHSVAIPPGHLKINEEIHEEPFHHTPKPPPVGKRLVEPKPNVIGNPGVPDVGAVVGLSKSTSAVIRGHPPPPPPPKMRKINDFPPGGGNDGSLDSIFGPPPVERQEKPLDSPSGPPRFAPDLPTRVPGPVYPVISRPPPVEIKKKPVPPYHEPVPPHHEPVPPHHESVPPHKMPVLPQQFTGQGSFSMPEVPRPPPAGILIQEEPEPNRRTFVLPPGPRFVELPPDVIQESNTPPRGSLLTDISRVDEINAYLKAIDTLPLVKPPLEEKVLQVQGNSLEPVGPKNLTVDTKAETSTLAKGSRLALYFGNILLQVMSQAIGSARTAIGQYSMPSMI